MEWLIRVAGEHWGPIAALIVFPFAVWGELNNFLPIRQKQEERDPR